MHACPCVVVLATYAPATHATCAPLMHATPTGQREQAVAPLSEYVPFGHEIGALETPAERGAT